MRPLFSSRAWTLARELPTAACLAWGLALAGCNHPLAQRPHAEWASQRVLADDPDHRDARVKPVSRGGFYTLIREWDEDGDVPRDAPPPGEVRQVYVDAGELLGFHPPEGGLTDPSGERTALAIDGSRSVTITLADGVHYVWYRENNDADQIAQDLLLILGGAALIVGIVVLAANGDGTLEVDF